MKLLRLASRRKAVSGVGGRTYAIGDIHGRWDLFAALVELIEEDVRRRPPARPTRLVVLGDFIDRGPESRRLVETFTHTGAVILKGNHEAMLVDAWRGDHDALEGWIWHGGRATLESYGADLSRTAADDHHALMRITRRAIPRTVVDWLDGLPTSMLVDGHYFVHAGVRPGVGLDRQVDADRLWIDRTFTDSPADHGAVIVHGHSISDDVVFAANRIGVDTGAYRTGRLSAVAIENGRPWVLATGSPGRPQ